MQYIYVSTACSDERYSQLFRQGVVRSGQQAQKFNNLLIKGLAMHEKVEAVSVIPVSSRSARRKYPADVEVRDNVRYTIIGTLNIPLLRGIWNLFSILKNLLRILKNKEPCIILCDTYSLSCSIATRMAAKIKKIKSVAIVTDLPQHLNGNKGVGKVVYSLMKRYDGYILLTEAMNEKVNKKEAPKLVIEGSCEQNMATQNNSLREKHNPKVCLFAGSLTPNAAGLELLTEAFIKVHPDDYELHIYGAGPLEEYFKAKMQEHPCVKYLGCVENSVVVQKQIEATVLINPRKTDAEYTKFSFPSKLIEYLASGTPVVTTRLPGIPQEYYPYLYTIEGNELLDYENALRNVFSQSPETLHLFGMEAKQFVISDKSNKKQGEKIIRWIENELVVK